MAIEKFITRGMLRVGLYAVIAFGLAAAVAENPPRNRAPEAGNGAGRAVMPTRPLGRTGHQVSLFSLGGQATIERPGRDGQAAEIINRALDLGVNFIDTAPRYGNGTSERYIGRVMRERRDEVFLATKSHDYTYEGTMRLVRESLERLQTDRIDLYQHHNVGSERQLAVITGENGALRAFRELKEKNVVSFIGITSHSPRVLLRALELDAYDCMLITLNPAGASMSDRAYLAEFLDRAREKEVGVIGMKVAGRGTLLGRPGVKMDDLLGYTLSHPVATAVVGISETWQVDDNARIAREFRPLPGEEKRALEKKFERD